MPMHVLPGADAPQKPIPFERINADDWRLIGECARRAYAWMWDYKLRSKRDDLMDPDLQLIAMDIAVAHLNKNLKLYQWLLSSDFDFIAELVLITKHVDRTCGFFPSAVKLAFEQSGDCSIIHTH